MAMKQQEKQPAVAEKHDYGQHEAVIGGHVMRALGQPGNLNRVQVRRLWGDHYRVNIFVGADTGSARVAHSYFLTADSAGSIIACNPQIKKEY